MTRTSLIVPPYSRRQIIEAGKALRGRIQDDSRSIEDASEVFRLFHAWRTAHQVPMRHIRAGMLAQMRRCGIEGLTAARLKRTRSIRDKLAKGISLLDMQDIGGCRAIVETPGDAETLGRLFRERLRHEARDEDRDYISAPKDDGYRSLHQVYRYRGTGEFAALNDRRLLTEVQIRTRPQHAWATAVETVGAIQAEDLKHGAGSAQWLRFFALAASEMAAAEDRPLVPGTPANPKERLEELRALDRELNAVAGLDQMREAVKAVGQVRLRMSEAFIVTLDASHRTVTVHSVSPGATALDYRAAEQHYAKNSVLVEVERAEDLREAYPNYYLDAGRFTEFLNGRLKSRPNWTSAEGLRQMLERARSHKRLKGR